MRISDWSSDVCSSDLQCIRHVFAGHQGREGHYLQARQARFLGGRYIRKLRSALVARNRQRLQLACLYVGNDRWNVLEQPVDLPAQKIVQGGGTAFIGNMSNRTARFNLDRKSVV